MKPSVSPTAIQILLESLIDYAGLFPPASLDMKAAVTSYDTYTRSQESKMLGRFILPLSRVAEFEEALVSLPDTGSAQWELSLIVGADIIADIARLDKKHSRYVIKSVEVKGANAADIYRLSAIIPSEIETYFEIPLFGGMQECIDSVAKCGRRAKIRTGGETPDKFPASEDIAAFLQFCARAKIAFKATAGLHHPCRSIHRLTYQPDSPSGMMHGFLNLFLAAAFIYAGLEAGVAKELLEEQAPAAFHFEPKEVSWRGHRLDLDMLVGVRKNFALSFGSCSFTEPVDDLLLLGLL
jgi:hypothetical protein